MSFSHRDEEEEEDREGLFPRPVYVDETIGRERLLPSQSLAALMVAAYAWSWVPGRDMISWAVSAPRLVEGRYETILLHMFAHGGLLHLGFNVAVLLAIGPAIMERLGRLGTRTFVWFIVLFFACGLASLALWLALNWTSEVPMLGASGAIFGLLGAVLRQPDPQARPVPISIKAMRKPAFVFIQLHVPLIPIIALNILTGEGTIGIAWEAHLGGFIAGYLVAKPIVAQCGNQADWVPDAEGSELEQSL